MKSRSQTILDLICEIADRRRTSDVAILKGVEERLMKALSPATQRSLRDYLESKE